MRRGRPGTRHAGYLPVKAALVAASVLVSLMTIEGLIVDSLRHPDILRSADGMGLRAPALARTYYRRRDSRIIQYPPACARYDSERAYFLKPGNLDDAGGRAWSAGLHGAPPSVS